MIIGLTGQTGSGKSTVCEYLEKKGFYICNCDRVAVSVRSDARVVAEIADVFGFDLIGEDGKLDRANLAKRAFSSSEGVDRLNRIMLPKIVSRSLEMINAALQNGYEFAVLDAPLLFESGAYKFCDFIVAVTAKKSERIRRIIERDKIDENAAEERMNVQHGDAYYTERADFVIVNDSLNSLSQKCDGLLAVLNDYKADAK